MAKEKQIETQFKYANVNNLLGSTDTASQQSLGVNSVSNEHLTIGYKTALKNFMDRQMERSVK